MYKCKCGNLFASPKMQVEPTGEELPVCPSCKGDDFEHVDRCEICGKWLPDDELSHGFCLDCIKDYRYDHTTCFAVCNGQKENVKVNSLLASIFDEEEINKILISELIKRSKYQKIDCDLFISSDIDFFTAGLKRVRRWEE